MEGRYILLESFFSNAAPELTEQNSDELCHIFGSRSDLKMHVRNVGFLNKRVAPKLLIFGWFYCTSRLNRRYPRNGSRYRQTETKISKLRTIGYIFFRNSVNFIPSKGWE